MRYRDFDKGDARRYFTVLLAIDSFEPGTATIHKVANAIGSSRSEAQRAILVLEEQYGVLFARAGSSYALTSWGVIKKGAVIELVNAAATQKSENTSKENEK